jgi:hypothetical protein
MTSFSMTAFTKQVVTVTYSVSTFGTYISVWLDGARIDGCSHLPVVTREHKGLYPPSGCSQRIGELELPSSCSLKIGRRSLFSVAAGKQRNLVLPMNVILKDK